MCQELIRLMLNRWKNAALQDLFTLVSHFILESSQNPRSLASLDNQKISLTDVKFEFII